MIIRLYRRFPVDDPVGIYDPATGGSYEEFDDPALPPSPPAVLPITFGRYLEAGATTLKRPRGTRTFNRIALTPGVRAIYVEQ